MSDPLNDALREATLAVLLGSTEVFHQTVDPANGYVTNGTVTIESAFVHRLRSQAHEGQFDDLLRQAMEKVSVENVAHAIEGLLAERFIQGLQREKHWGQARPGWFEAETRKIAVEAATAALSTDEELLDTLRARVGMEVDRNKVSIAVQLSDPES